MSPSLQVYSPFSSQNPTNTFFISHFISSYENRFHLRFSFWPYSYLPHDYCRGLTKTFSSFIKFIIYILGFEMGFPEGAVSHVFTCSEDLTCLMATRCVTSHVPRSSGGVRHLVEVMLSRRNSRGGESVLSSTFCLEVFLLVGRVEWERGTARNRKYFSRSFN